MKKISLNSIFIFLLLFGLITSCSEEESPLVDDMEQSEGDNDPSGDDSDDGTGSDDSGNDDSGSDTGDDGNGEGTGGDSGGNCEPQDEIILEADGYVLAEIERNAYSDPWEIENVEPNFSGEGYIVWTGTQYLGNPGNGLTTFKILISNPGTYEFVWNTSVTIGSSGTDHNDTWLRFPDADDFFAQNGGSVVYPHGSGKSPNPAGAGSDGWFKVYRSGNDLSFKWQAYTFDNNPHKIYVTFNSAGEYTMEISARSSGHAIDKFVLFQDSYSLGDVTGEGTADSEVSCGN
ncbi:MAG: hypothetical protein WBM43_10830 [Flavobacteriaceae bacterium]